MKTILFGAGSDLGVHMDGAHLGPTQLINDLSGFFSGEVVSLKQDDHILKSRNLSDKRKNKYEVMEFNRKLFKAITSKYEEEMMFPITIGGDSSVSIASALASSFVNEEIGVIVFSAHTDYNTVDTSITGNIHGTTLASINGQCKEFNDFFEKKAPAPNKTVVIGARSIDEGEKDTIKYSGLTVFTTEDIKADENNDIVNHAFDIAAHRTKGVHIIFDLGLIDPDISTGVSVPSIDGIDEEKAMQLIDMILDKFDNVLSFDLVEFNPLRDIGKKTEQIAVNILAKVIKKANTKVVLDLKKSSDSIAEIIKADEAKHKVPATEYVPPQETTPIPADVTPVPIPEQPQPQPEVALGTITGYTKQEVPSTVEVVQPEPMQNEEPVVTEIIPIESVTVQEPVITPIDPVVSEETTTVEEVPQNDLGYVIAPPIITSINTEEKK